MSDLTQQGITALNAGDKQKARQLFRKAIEENPLDIQAWLWLSGAVETDQERLECFQAIIKLDPEHTLASKGIARLIADGNIELQFKPSELEAPVLPQQSQSKDEALATESQIPRLVFETRPSPIPVLVGSILTIIFVSLMFGFIAFLFNGNNPMKILFWILLCLTSVIIFGGFLLSLLRVVFDRYQLIDNFLSVQSGVFPHGKKTIPVTHIRNVGIDQQLLLRPFRIGDLLVEVDGEVKPIRLYSVPGCREFADRILELVSSSDSRT